MLKQPADSARQKSQHSQKHIDKCFPANTIDR